MRDVSSGKFSTLATRFDNVLYTKHMDALKCMVNTMPLDTLVLGRVHKIEDSRFCNNTSNKLNCFPCKYIKPEPNYLKQLIFSVS